MMWAYLYNFKRRGGKFIYMSKTFALSKARVKKNIITVYKLLSRRQAVELKKKKKKDARLLVVCSCSVSVTHSATHSHWPTWFYRAARADPIHWGLPETNPISMANTVTHSYSRLHCFKHAYKQYTAISLGEMHFSGTANVQTAAKHFDFLKCDKDKEKTKQGQQCT